MYIKIQVGLSVMERLDFSYFSRGFASVISEFMKVDEKGEIDYFRSETPNKEVVQIKNKIQFNDFIQPAEPAENVSLALKCIVCGASMLHIDMDDRCCSEQCRNDYDKITRINQKALQTLRDWADDKCTNNQAKLAIDSLYYLDVQGKMTLEIH